MSRVVIRTYDPKKEKNVVVGYLYGNKFIKHAKKGHYMIKEKGFGLQEDVILQLSNFSDCDTVVIKTKAGDFYSAFEQWKVRPLKNYGYGPQRFLPIKEMIRRSHA